MMIYNYRPSMKVGSLEKQRTILIAILIYASIETRCIEFTIASLSNIHDGGGQRLLVKTLGSIHFSS